MTHLCELDRPRDRLVRPKRLARGHGPRKVGVVHTEDVAPLPGWQLASRGDDAAVGRREALLGRSGPPRGELPGGDGAQGSDGCGSGSGGRPTLRRRGGHVVLALVVAIVITGLGARLGTCDLLLAATRGGVTDS